MFSLRDAIYLIELAFYGPIIPAIVFIILIHGSKSPYTWRPVIIPLIILSGLRITGASLGLAAMTPGRSSLLTIAALLDTIGLAPVSCILIGLLIRANQPTPHGLSIWMFIVLQLTVIFATVMTAYGGRDLYAGRDSVNLDLTLMRAGIVIFMIVFTIIVILAILTMLVVRAKFYRTERMAAICVLLCVPFMSARLVYSAGSVFFLNQSVLNPVTDAETSVWLHFFMVIIMEYVMAMSATAVALTARKVFDLTTDKAASWSENEA